MGRRAVLGGAAAFLMLSVVAGASQLADEQKRQQAREFYQLGQSHMQSEEWDQAEAAFKQAVSLDPMLTLAHYGLGQVYMNTHDYAQAVPAFRRCQESFLQLSALATTDRAAAELRLEREIQDTKDAIIQFQANRPKANQGTQDAREGDMRLEA